MADAVGTGSDCATKAARAAPAGAGGAGAGAAPAAATAAAAPAAVSGAEGSAAPAGKESKTQAKKFAASFEEGDFPAGLPKGPEKAGAHSYSQPAGSSFDVRSKTYGTDNVKMGSGDAICDLVHVDLFKSPNRESLIAERSWSFVQKAIAAGDTRFFIVITFQAPGASRTHCTLTYALPVDGSDSVGDKPWSLLWRRFMKGDDEFRNQRWKVIPRIAEGNWMVKRAVGTKPALLGTKLTHDWVVTDRYLDVSVDVASSSMASVLVGMLQQYAKYLVIDLAFVIQGNDPEELPEHVLGTARLSRINLSTAMELPPHVPASAQPVAASQPAAP